MGLYIYQHPKTGEVKEVVQKMNDKHVFFDNDGVEWKRVFTNPQAAIDTKWDANSERNFVEQTKKKKGTVGDLWEKSKELSEIREKQKGVDPVAVKANEEYKKLHRGQDKPEIKKKKLKEYLKKTPFEWSD